MRPDKTVPSPPDEMPLESLSPEQIERGVLIGVCGVSASGKTVFLTCIYRSASALPVNRGVLTVDPSETGGALYFEMQERSIREIGSTEGSREEFVARLTIERRLPGREPETIPVYLLDFAGVNFPLLADIKNAESQNLTPEQRRSLKKVNHYIRHCDGLIVLTSAQSFDYQKLAHPDIPFPTAVDHLVSESLKVKRPMALLFSQADTNRDLEKLIDSFPTVQRFRRNFTSDPKEASKGQKPFGIVGPLLCYEKDLETGRAKKQDAEGGIWRPDAMEAFSQILQEAIPRRDARRLRAENRRRGQKLKQAALAACLCFLVALGLLGAWYVWRTSTANAEVRFVEGLAERLGPDEITSVTPEEIARLARSGSQLEPEHGEVVESLWLQFLDDVREFLRQPPAALDKEYDGKLLAYQNVAAALPAPPPAWWSEEVEPALNGRRELLAAWPKHQSQGWQDFLPYLAERRQASEGKDPSFARYLRSLAAQRGDAIFTQWEQALRLKSTVQERLDAIRGQSEQLSKTGDLETQARQKLAGWALESALELEDNPTMLGFLKAAVPSDQMQALGEKNLPFRRIYELLDEKANTPECAQLWQQSQDTLQAYRDKVANRQALMVSTLTDVLPPSPEEAREVGTGMVDAAKKRYLFNLQITSSAWPDGVVRPRIETVFGEPIERFAEVIAAQPLYEAEMQAIQNMVLQHCPSEGMVDVGQ